MRNKATQNMYDTDGAGREFFCASTEDQVNARLEAKGFTVESMGKDAYDRLYDEELMAMVAESEGDYAEMLADNHESFLDNEEFFINQPGGEADYVYG